MTDAVIHGALLIGSICGADGSGPAESECSDFSIVKLDVVTALASGVRNGSCPSTTNSSLLSQLKALRLPGTSSKIHGQLQACTATASATVNFFTLVVMSLECVCYRRA